MTRRDYLTLTLATLGTFFLLYGVAFAGPSELPHGITCEYVRTSYNKWWFIGRPAIKRYLISVEGYTLS